MPEGERMNHLFYGTFNENNIMIGLDMRFYFWAGLHGMINFNQIQFYLSHAKIDGMVSRK